MDQPRTDPAPLAGQAALVTGGGSGIGLECARRLVADGATVTLMGRTPERLEQGAADLAGDAAPGAGVHTVVGDVADEADVARAVAAAGEPLGGLHLVVASAGTGGLGPIVTTPLAEWDRILAVNLTGTFLTFKHGGAALVRSGGGAMVAISSIAGVSTHRYYGPYNVSKAGVDMLVRTTADELGLAGVRVCSVRPGLVETDLVTPILGDGDIVGDYLDQMPVRRLGQVDDVANLVRFLLGEEAGWITGTTISVDGGHHLRRGPNLETTARALFGDEAVDGQVGPDLP